LGDKEKAMEHMEKAVTIEPEHVLALNNLGYGLTQFQDPPDFNRALNLLDRAVSAGQAAGNVPHECWETRGQIYAHLNRWREAASDLERALKLLGSRKEIHQTLTDVYAHLGQDSLAQQHLNMASTTSGGF